MRRSLLILFALPFVAGPLAAQALAREDLALLDPSRGVGRTQTELTLGKAALERATTNGGWGDYQEAVRRFEEAALRSPDLAEPWFGLALSRLALSETGANAVLSPTQPLGAGNRAAWAAHIRAALARDPRHLGALTSVTHVLLPQGDREQPEWLRAALTRAESLGVVTPDLALIRGRLARQERRYEEAAAAFREYGARGGDPSIAALEEARVLAGLGDLEGAAAVYDRGLGTLTPAGKALFSRDLALIAEGDELAPLDDLAPIASAAWIRHFWDRRDALDVREPGERLKEHLRRWAIAYDRYRVAEPDRRVLFHEPWAPIQPCVPSDSFSLAQTGVKEVTDPTDTRRDERILDDRGLMYLRHGDPLRVVWTLGASARDQRAAEAADRTELSRAELPSSVANTEIALRARARSLGDPGADIAEVWTYLIDGRVRSFLFHGSNYLGTSAPTTLTADLTSPELVLLRAQVDPRFQSVWTRYEQTYPPKVPVACLPSVQQIAQEVRADLVVGGTTDDHPLLFAEPAIPAVQVAAVGHPAEHDGQVLVAYALPAEHLTYAPVEGGIEYPLHWRLTAVDSTGRIERTDGELLPTRRTPLTQGSFLTGLLALPIPAGRWTIGVALFQPDERRGGAVVAQGVSLDSTSLAMSDLLLGREDDSLVWRGAPLNPLGTWREGSVMLLSAELHGVEAGTPITTVVEIRRLERNGPRPSVRVASTTPSEGPAFTLRRSVGLQQLRPGSYELRLTTSTPTATIGTRVRTFEVLRRP